MDHCCQKKIKIIDRIPKNEKLDFNRPKGKIILYYDQHFEVPMFEIKLNGFLNSSMRIWPDRLSREKVIDKLHSGSIHSSFSSGIDKKFKKKCIGLSFVLVMANKLKPGSKIKYNKKLQNFHCNCTVSHEVCCNLYGSSHSFFVTRNDSIKMFLQRLRTLRDLKILCYKKIRFKF